MKRFTALMLSIIMVLSVNFSTNIDISYAKAQVGLESIVDNKITYVSLRKAYKEYGGTYNFVGSIATAKSGRDVVKVDAKAKTYTENGKAIKVSGNPIIKNNEMYVPIAFLNEVMNARAAVNQSTKKVEIKRAMDLKYSKGFSVNYLKGGLKVVYDGDKRPIILVPKGKSVPEKYQKYTVIQTPINSVLAASTTQGCQLRAVGALSAIKGVTTKESQWKIKEVAAGLKAGSIKYVGENAAPDYEAIKVLKPDVTFTYTGYAGLQNMNAKLKELKLDYVVCNEYLEEDPRGRMEWMKLYGAFFNKEEQAEVLFNKAVANIDKTATAAKALKKPTVAWAMVYGGKVYVASPDSYVGKMIDLAGGDYIYAGDKVGSGSITLEEFYAKAKNADILIYSSLQQYTPNLKDVVVQAPVLANLKAVKEKKVWCFAPNYYQALDKTDAMIQELSDIFHKNEKDLEHFIKY